MSRLHDIKSKRTKKHSCRMSKTSLNVDAVMNQKSGKNQSHKRV